MKKVLCVFVALLFIAAGILTAGCVSTASSGKEDPVVGTWAGYNSATDYYVTFDIRSDGTHTISSIINGNSSDDDGKWVILSDNHYQIGGLEMTLSGDGKTLVDDDDPDFILVKDGYFVKPTQSVTNTPIPTRIETPKPTEICTVSVYDDQVTVEVLELIEGQTAADIVYAANRYNTIPKEDQTAYIVKMNITLNVIGKLHEQYGQILITPSREVMVHVNGVDYYSSPVTLSSYPIIMQDYLAQDRSISGWLYFIVPTGNATISLNGSRIISNSVYL